MFARVRGALTIAVVTHSKSGIAVARKEQTSAARAAYPTAVTVVIAAFWVTAPAMVATKHNVLDVHRVARLAPIFRTHQPFRYLPTAPARLLPHGTSLGLGMTQITCQRLRCILK